MIFGRYNANENVIIIHTDTSLGLDFISNI